MTPPSVRNAALKVDPRLNVHLPRCRYPRRSAIGWPCSPAGIVRLVVDSERHLAGVLTQTDLLAAVYHRQAATAARH